MATSAFRSTTKRTPIPSSTADSSSSIRRSRSLSRFSRRLTTGNDDSFVDDAPRAPKGRFVNTVRGSGFPEITLDDLAIDFFGSSGDRGRSESRRESDVSPMSAAGISRRGRSVSRKSSSGSFNSGGGSTNSEVARRRRSVSVVRCQISDSESDVDNLCKSAGRVSSVTSSRASSQKPASRKPKVMKDGQALRRSTSQKYLKHYDDNSSHSSALTDEEAKDANSSRGTAERTIRAVYAQMVAEHPTGEDVNAGLYQAMRKELRNAMEQMRMDLEQVILKSNPSLANGGQLPLDNTDVLRAVSSIGRNYTSKLPQSERCKQDLLAEILLEEERGKGISKIVKDSPSKSKTNGQEKPRSRKRSNDRCRMSKCLSEEAEKYIQDFISNVEDTDISSLDGDRSDTSSNIGGVLKRDNVRANADLQPLVEMDGVVLPWLQWETSNEVSTPSREQTMQSPPIRKSYTTWTAVEDSNEVRDQSHVSSSSLGSCSPGTVNGPSTAGRYVGILCGDVGKSNALSPGRGFDMDEYLKKQSEEDFLIERWRQGKRIDSGGMILCDQMFF